MSRAKWKLVSNMILMPHMCKCVNSETTAQIQRVRETLEVMSLAISSASKVVPNQVISEGGGVPCEVFRSEGEDVPCEVIRSEGGDVPCEVIRSEGGSVPCEVIRSEGGDVPCEVIRSEGGSVPCEIIRSEGGSVPCEVNSRGGNTPYEVIRGEGGDVTSDVICHTSQAGQGRTPPQTAPLHVNNIVQEQVSITDPTNGIDSPGKPLLTARCVHYLFKPDSCKL